MMKQDYLKKSIIFLLVILSGTLFFPSASLGLMSSTNYTIFADTVDSGGLLSASGTFSLQDSVGESPVGSSSSSVYQVIAGYQAMDFSALVISVSPTTIDLGDLDVNQVASSSAVVSVSADADSGYVLSVGNVSGTHLANVSDGSVTAGSEEYGVAASGIDAAFNDDRAIVAGLNLSSSSTPVDSAQTTLTFKGAISSASTVGGRSQLITLTASTSI
ncbi:MAG TPA: hypothetical protein VLK22_03420 [Candidatus Udaeobacter sp.]|nr:hypothetical protein [Candidatus Udaeobacter sp.]